MFTSTSIRCALASGAAAAFSAPAQAQDPKIQEVVVTGSRIASPPARSFSEVATITDEDVAVSGVTRIEDLINRLPQAFAAQGATLSEGSDGTATIDLRGLGESRTLVLINGRRLGPGDPNSATFAADVNQIPGALVERIEILTGGASSVYGADAIGGVANFILDTRFDGVSVVANYTFYDHHNDNPVAAVVSEAGYTLPARSVHLGETTDLALVIGSGFADERGHATFYATYRDIAAVEQGNFDYGACMLNSGGAAEPVFTCGGSATSSPARFRVRDPRPGPTFNRATSYTLDPDTGATITGAPDPYNFGPLRYFQRPDERYTAGLFVDLTASERFAAYGELMLANDRSVAQVAPSGVFGTEYTISCANPLWSSAQEQAFCGQYGLNVSDDSTDTIRMMIFRRNVEGGGRRDENEHRSYRAVLGARGRWSDPWRYDAFAQYGATELSNVYEADLSITRAARALDVIAAEDGSAVCRSVVDGTDPSCVPYNLWTLNAVTGSQLDYLQLPLVAKGEVVERVLNASLSGELGAYGVRLPTAQEGVMVNVGIEWRQERSDFIPDASYRSGEGAGQSVPTLPLSGGFTATDLFAEARVPLAEGALFIDSLVAEVGYRHSEYSNDWRAETYKFGLQWSPIPSIRLRGSYQRAMRVPNASELFSIQRLAQRGTIDPCATPIESLGESPALTPEQCARTGVAPRDDEAQSGYGWIEANGAARYNAYDGGNPLLEPEGAETWSFGVELQPGFLPGMRLQLDYYDIRVEDAIQRPNADFTVLSCALSGEETPCSKVRRDESGSLWLSDAGFVVDMLENTGELRTRGFDVDASYAFELGSLGDLRLSFVGTLMDTYELTPQPGVRYDCRGLYGTLCTNGNPTGAPLAAWKHRLNATWNLPWQDLSWYVGWRYIDAVQRDAESNQEFLAFLGTATGALATDSILGSRSYIDLSAAITVQRCTVRIGAANLFDQDPPLTGAASCPSGPCNGNTWPQTYDALGRQWFATIRMDF